MALSAKTPSDQFIPARFLAVPFKHRRPRTPNFYSKQIKPCMTLKNGKKLRAISRNLPSTPTCDLSSEIRRLCLNGDLELALQRLTSSKETPLEEDAYIALLGLCEWRRNGSVGSQVYSHISSSNIRLTLRLGNALLSMFIRFDEVLVAWNVFARMVQRDVFSWNVMLSGYGRSGFFEEALTLYYRMLWEGVRPDLYTFPCVLRTCGGIPDLARGREIHAHVVRFGFCSEVDVLNAVITMYAKCGCVDVARRVFDKMPRRDCISWNSMISGYFENGEYAEGSHLFLVMRHLSVEPDLMTMTSVISASGFHIDERFGKEIHGFALKKGFCVEISMHNSLIQMYASTRSLMEAKKVFLRMESKDVVTWTAMICGFERNNSSDMALHTFEQMKSENVPPDEITIASVLSACASLGRVDVGIELQELARKKGLMPCAMVGNTLLDMYCKSQYIDKALETFRLMPSKDVISWSSIITGFRINRRSFEALKFFRQMQFDVKPNSIALVVAVSACGSIGALMCGQEIHAHALRTGYGSQGFLPNAILDMYVKCGNIKYAWKQFKLHEEKDVVSWNILLSGHAGRGHGEHAVALFHEMEDEGIQPDEVTFVSLLCACSRSGMLKQGSDYFRDMSQKYRITPNLKHYSCMVDLFSRAGHLGEALRFIRDVPIEPDPAIWGALLNGCRIHRNVELGELAAEHIFELDSQSAGYYILLCNLYADCGEWDKLARIRRLMKERGLIIDPGCCWVEAKGKIHAFLSADESHPQIKEINAVLSGLYDRMKAAGFDLLEYRFIDSTEASKDDVFCGHSERLGVAFGLISSAPGRPIRVTKNLYMCRSCHIIVKGISKLVRREITVRDVEQFHHFKDGECSCGDEGYWGRNGGRRHLNSQMMNLLLI
ncbi:Pentatricopeptide repeat-containing protein [Apostasia shenzhenica]|uniref:Pentatricopeptide repeat-containing protein n=1 Tax=Apostasia shenzhenica TaxID=1088818 RepID=A0A2I0BA72_9ASPA|nr:Pentatricopeptide repeat-containing protein [Apostasia shenzhenica]